MRDGDGDRDSDGNWKNPLRSDLPGSQGVRAS